jgi:hypothetical protein
MGKLHELIAVEKDIKTTLSKILEETAKTFNQRSSHFLESIKTYHPFKEEDKDLPDDEHVPMSSTVREKLDYAQGHVVRAIDVVLQKESANQEAKSDVIVELPDGSTEKILEEAPVTFLVQMENILESLRRTYNTIPTLDPAKKWHVDETTENVWISDEIKKVRTKKVPRVITKAEATEKFPAQADIVHMDEAVGEFTQVYKCGGLSSKQKSYLLDRIDRLIAAVKIARAKANGQEVKSKKIGAAMFNFINKALEN